MTDYQTISWIFLATALASQERGTNAAGISAVADGINHSVPTQKELQTSFKWLLAKDLVVKEQGKYNLTDQGQELFQQVRKRSDILLEMWEILETDLKSVNENNVA